MMATANANPVTKGHMTFGFSNANNRVEYIGEVVAHSDDTGVIDPYVAVSSMMLGYCEPTGDLKRLPREHVRIFGDRKEMVAEAQSAMRANRQFPYSKK